MIFPRSMWPPFGSDQQGVDAKSANKAKSIADQVDRTPLQNKWGQRSTWSGRGLSAQSVDPPRPPRRSKILCLLGVSNSVGRCHDHRARPPPYLNESSSLLVKMGYCGSRAATRLTLVFEESEGTGSGVADRFASSAPTFEVGDHLKFISLSRFRMKWSVLRVPRNTGSA
jgi:hypothetical protein